MTVVAICALAIAALISAAPVMSVFGPPSGLQRDGEVMALDMARDQCEQSLTHSIRKRTEASADEAGVQAERRCEMLLTGASAKVIIVTPHEI